MLLKDDLLIKIIGGIEEGAGLLKEEKLKESEAVLRSIVDLSKSLTIDDLEISKNHVEAVMKQKEYDNEEDALKYILFQIRDFALKGILGNLMALVILSFVEKINRIQIEEDNK